jgi:hypothetical protein
MRPVNKKLKTIPPQSARLPYFSAENGRTVLDGGVFEEYMVITLSSFCIWLIMKILNKY